MRPAAALGSHARRPPVAIMLLVLVLMMLAMVLTAVLMMVVVIMTLPLGTKAICIATDTHEDKRSRHPPLRVYSS